MKPSQLSFLKTCRSSRWQPSHREVVHQTDAETGEAVETTEAAAVEVASPEVVRMGVRQAEVPVTVQTRQNPVAIAIIDMVRKVTFVQSPSPAHGLTSAPPDPPHPHEGPADLDKIKTKTLITTLCFPD